MNNEIHGEDLQQMIESTGSPAGSRAFDELAVIFVVSPAGAVREQWFTPTCGHVVEQGTCSTCKAEQERRERSRSRFEEYNPELPQLCVCDFPDGAATVAQREKMEGHYNEVGGFCCPHHGNTCGHCHKYN